MDFSTFAGIKDAEQFLRERKILVADSSGTIRRSITSVLTDLGAKTHNIITCGDFMSALNELNYRRPSVVITEYKIGSKCGLALLEKFVENYPDQNERLFVIAAANGSETAVAEAAEEEIDSYVLKPFNSMVLGQYLIKAIRKKFYPSAYRETINQGKNNLRDGKLDAALEIFEQAKILSKKPCLACYYTGFTYEKKGRMAEARANYEEGLTYNAIHYKCLSGLFDLLVKTNVHGDAYAVSRDLTSFYPMNSKRLTNLLHLAVITGNFKDIRKYHEMYTQLDYRPEDAMKTVAAALLVAGKFHLRSGQEAEAIETFALATQSSKRNPQVITKVILNLAEKSCWPPIKEFFERYNPIDQNTLEYRMGEMICDFSERRFDRAVIHGRSLLAEGHQDPQIYRYLIKANLKLGRSKASSELTEKALSLWPKMAEQILD